MGILSGLSALHLRRFAIALDRLYGEEADVDDYARLSCEVLKGALDADGCTFAERDWARTGRERPMDGFRTLWSEPFDNYPGLMAHIATICEGGPAWTCDPGGRVQLLSDFFSPPSLRDHVVYQEGMREIRMFYNLNFGFRVHQAIDIQFGVCREGTCDFDEADRALATALAPHLRKAYRIAVLRRWRSFDAAAAADNADLALTERQRAVLRWVVAGKSNEMIGDILGISRETVKVHLRRIYDRLGVSNRVGAALRVLDASPGFLPVAAAAEVGWSPSARNRPAVRIEDRTE